MREVPLQTPEEPVEQASFLVCVATVLELPVEQLPRLGAGEDPAVGWTISRWLGGLGVGLARIADARTFSWPGPWIARVGPSGRGGRRFVVMYGVPSGVVWDPAGVGAHAEEEIEDGFLIAAADVALALPPRPAAPTVAGAVEAICVAPSAGEPVQLPPAVRAISGRGLEGDRHVSGAGTFPSGPPGSALTMIAAEVCESFEPPLEPGEHRRNLVTRGIDLNALVGHDFTIGRVPCRGMRLCEPCTVVQRYAARPVLRELVHRGGLRADILADGEIRVGDPVRATTPPAGSVA
jgi:hypothetical protein